MLSTLLVSHFFVDAIWVRAYEPLTGRSGTVLEICGTPANLEMAVYVHAFLTHTAQSLWEAHKKVTGTKSNRDRQTFLAGVMVGFKERMDNEQKSQQEQGLVWLRDAGIQDYVKARYPRTRNVRTYGNRRNLAREHGKNAGRDIILRKPVEGTSSDRGKLLSGG